MCNLAIDEGMKILNEGLSAKEILLQNMQNYSGLPVENFEVVLGFFQILSDKKYSLIDEIRVKERRLKSVLK